MDPQVNWEEIVGVMGEKLKQAEIDHAHALVQIKTLHAANKRLHETIEGLTPDPAAEKEVSDR